MDIPVHQLHAGKHGIHGGNGFAAGGIQMQQPGRVRFQLGIQAQRGFRGARDGGHSRGSFRELDAFNFSIAHLARKRKQAKEKEPHQKRRP